MNNDNKKNKNPQHQSDETDEKKWPFCHKRRSGNGCLFFSRPPEKRRFNFGSFDTLLHVPLHVLAGGVMRGQEGCDGEAPALRITKNSISIRRPSADSLNDLRMYSNPIFSPLVIGKNSNPSHSRLSSFLFFFLSLSLDGATVGTGTTVQPLIQSLCCDWLNVKVISVAGL